MGVDLTLLPLYSKSQWFAPDMVSLNRRRELWDLIEDLPQTDVPEPVSCHLACNTDGETAYGDIEKDPYGNRLQWTTAGALVSLKDHPTIQDCWQNRGIWAMLAEMPEDWPIVLYWC